MRQASVLYLPPIREAVALAGKEADKIHHPLGAGEYPEDMERAEPAPLVLAFVFVVIIVIPARFRIEIFKGLLFVLHFERQSVPDTAVLRNAKHAVRVDGPVDVGVL